MSDHNERAHAILGASSSSRWLSCPGSVRLIEKAPPQKTSEYAALGTAAHDLAEKCLLQNKDAVDFKGKKINGFKVDFDMIEAVQVYVDLIRKESKGHDLKIEERFSLEWVHSGMFGTNDAGFGEDFGDLYIYDYKHGAGIAVEAENNTQMIYYAIGAAYNRKLKDFDDYQNIHMTIVQPRAQHSDGPIRRWTISMEELVKWVEVLKEGAKATEDPNAPLNPSESNCRWCAAATFCPALNDKAQEVARTDFASPLPDPGKMEIEKIAKVVAHKKLLVNFIDACEERLKVEMLDNKKVVEGVKVVRGRGATVWNDALLAEKTLKEKHGDRIYKKKLLTPLQAQAVLGEENVKGMFKKVQGDLTVAPESDRRKPVNINPELDFKGK